MTNKQLDDANYDCYLHYCKTAMRYESLLELEQDPKRQELLKAMLADLHEENK